MAAEKKPRAVVLGQGELVVSYGTSRSRTSVYLWDRDRQRRVYFSKGKGHERGTLLWIPDPPKPKTKRGKR